MYKSRVEWLNYHHLLYFWTVARLGSIARASTELRLAQPTISGQLRLLEESLGARLFDRVGRGLVLTEIGTTVFRFSEEIFGLGREMVETLRGQPSRRRMTLAVGIADVVPKLVAYRLLKPALGLTEKVRLVCREGTPEHLLAELAVHRLDIVIADAPVPSTMKLRAYSHLLGECGASFFATPGRAALLRRRFPRSLSGATVLLPGEHSAMGRAIAAWLESQNIRPEVVGEFDDGALMKTFGQAGAGVFAGPTAIERDICGQYRVRVIGRAESLKERFYAISCERKIKHPAVAIICDAARSELFAS
jgi:LysR family transcriptional activator of nhaA